MTAVTDPYTVCIALETKGNALIAKSIKILNKGSIAENTPLKIFSNPSNNGCSFLVAFSESLNAATKPPTKETSKPIPVAFNAPLNDCVATLALFKAVPNEPIGPPALAKESTQSDETFLADLILSSKSSI